MGEIVASDLDICKDMCVSHRCHQMSPPSWGMGLGRGGRESGRRGGQRPYHERVRKKTGLLYLSRYAVAGARMRGRAQEVSNKVT